MDDDLSDDQLLRYSRHILLDEIGIAGQRNLLAAHVLVVGAGGLGCAAIAYLAAAGIGTLTIVDDDVVDLTNLQRQILHTAQTIGLAKVDSARDAVKRLNPDITLNAIHQRADGEWLAGVIERVDVVVDCTDNFRTRQMINRACVDASVPLVSGAAIRFGGQVSVFDTRAGGPCYACLFPPSSPVTEVACATMGVFAPLVGLVGALQAVEALKLIVRTGRSLTGRLLMVDAHEMEWTTLRVERNHQCEVCGERSRRERGREPGYRESAAASQCRISSFGSGR